MKNMKYIKILPILLCVFCLTGCQETENESNKVYDEQKISEEKKTGDVDKIEENTRQETYASESESQEGMKLNEEEPDYDEYDSIEQINKYMIPEQSFDVSLDDWGEVQFVSRRPAPGEFGDWRVATFYLVKDDQVLYKFPYRFENNSSRGYIGIFDSVGAIAFRDINGDKKDDIIIITYYTSGAGPTGMVPRPGVTIYLAGDSEFCLAEDMIIDVEENIVEQDRTIANIYNFLQHRE